MSLEQIRAFWGASQEIEFEAANRQAVYDWVTRALCEQEYWKQNRGVQGLLRRYIGKMRGLDRVQVRRLISRYKKRAEPSGRGTSGGTGLPATTQPTISSCWQG
jgi:hypothetical protein